MRNEVAPPEKKELNRLLIFALLIALFVSGLDMSVVNIMLPKLQTLFSAPISQTMLIATVYLTMMSAFQLLAGRCADIFNALNVFIVGLLLFFTGSLGCALSQSLSQIIVGRGIQGVGAAIMAASFGAIILTHVPRERTGSVLGTVLMVMSLGVVVGPPLGGFLAEHLSWHWAFLLNLPLAGISAVILLRVANTSSSNATISGKPPLLQQLDFKGSLSSVIIFIALPTLFTVGAQNGWLSLPLLGVLLIFLTSLAFFIWTENKSPCPLIQLEIFRKPTLVLAMVIKMLTMVLMTGVMLVFPFLITGSSTMDVSQAGLYILISAVAMSITTPIAGKMTDRYQGIPVILLASVTLLMTCIGAFFIGPPLAKAIMGIVLAGFGASLATLMVASSVLILKQAPPGREGVFSALNSLVVPVGGSMGLAIFSSLYSHGEANGLPGVQSFSGFTLSMQGAVVCVVLLLASALLYRFLNNLQD